MEKDTRRDVSRRQMMKRLGAGAAIVWTAPVLSSLNVPAHAQLRSPGCTTCDPGGCHCPAPDCQPFCNEEGTCSCLITSRGDCFCHDFVSCGDPRVAACADDSTCPAGWRCSSSCCGENLCHPPCGANVDAQPVGATSGGTF